MGWSSVRASYKGVRQHDSVPSNGWTNTAKAGPGNRSPACNIAQKNARISLFLRREGRLSAR